MNYISANEYYTGRPDDYGSILKKLNNQFKGFKEINLNLIDFINHNQLDMILNNDLIRNDGLYFEFYNYAELNAADVEEVTNEIKIELNGNYSQRGFNTIDTIYNSYYGQDLTMLELLTDPEEAINELREAIEEYAADMFYEWNGEIYQYFIVSEYDALNYWLKYTNYPILYDDNANIFLVGITHYGMSWKYFTTNFKVRVYL